MVQSEIIASLMAESLHNSLKPMWASMITQKDMVINLSIISDYECVASLHMHAALFH